jgi:aminoglycoside phosphotransferase family enzyme
MSSSSSSSNQFELISILRKNRGAYPHEVSKLELEETHISWVILTGKYVYKIKKELKFGQILDFSTLALRKKFCQKEVDINKVLCGDMYKGVVKVVQQKRGQDEENRLRIVDLKSKGRALEYAVKMLEIPQKFRMDNLLQEDKINTHTIDELTSTLVKFHNSSTTNSKIKSFGKPEFIKRKVDENFATLSKLTNINNHKLERSLKSFIENKRNLLLQRIRDGKVRDIHGDLYLKNIFIVPDNKKFYLYDRIEFNDSLRYADVAEDVAHLAMDLDFHGRSDLRKYFISAYLLQSKDTHLEDIVYFLMCYKACMRVKVCLFRAEGLDKTNSNDRVKIEQAEEEARNHLELAESYLELLK